MSIDDACRRDYEVFEVGGDGLEGTPKLDGRKVNGLVKKVNKARCFADLSAHLGDKFVPGNKQSPLPVLIVCWTKINFKR
jgi:hypothetical protein